MLTSLYPHSNKLLAYKLQSIHPRTNYLCMKAIHYACFKLEEKATRSIKKNKTNFINVKIEDKFTMGIR